MRTLEFDLPAALEAAEPPEARGLRRDQVRLMVSSLTGDRITHGRFHDLPAHLAPGDVLVVNTSGTLNAALPARRRDQTVVELHLSTRLPAHLWIVEMRVPDGLSSKPCCEVQPGETFELPAGGTATLSEYAGWVVSTHFASLSCRVPAGVEMGTIVANGFCYYGCSY